MTDTVLEPRIARTREVVFAAAIDIVAERGFAGATIDAIARRAGVARSTIYRNWPNRIDLLLEATATEIGGIEAIPVGDLRRDLVTLVRHLADVLASDRLGSIAAALIVESRRDAELDALRERFLGHRRRAVGNVMRAAIERGEVRADTDVLAAVDELSAAVFYRVMILRIAVDEAWAERLADRWIESHGVDRTEKGDEDALAT